MERTQPHLKPGRVYRTKDLKAWARSPQALATRLVSEKTLQRLDVGLYLHPKQGRFGPLPPSEEELLRAFLNNKPYALSGGAVWSTLGLGTTAINAKPVVYNLSWSKERKVGSRTFVFRRTAFPSKPTREWQVVDMLNHADLLDASLKDVLSNLRARLADGTFSREKFQAMASKYGSLATKNLAASVLSEAVA